MLTHATNSTSATTTRIASSGRRYWPRSPDVPVAAGATMNASSRKCSRNPGGTPGDRAAARICGCTPRSSAVAESIDCPDLGRSSTVSSIAARSVKMRVFLPRMTRSPLSGIATSNERPTSVPKNPGAVTPTIGTGTRSTVSDVPTAFAAPPKRRCQNS